MSNWCACYTGGSGAGYHAKIVVQQTGQYNLVVGSGGVGRGGAKGEHATGTEGNASIVSKNGVELIRANGGGQAGWQYVGSGGILIKDSSLIESEVYTRTNGRSGNGGTFYAYGVAGPISGHTWGGSGDSGAGYAGGAANPSYNGYIMIKYVGPVPDMYIFTINPQPADATVTLTVDGDTYTQNSITVISGKTVSWSVNKSGYTTQTGSSTITQDTNLSVVLEELQEPLYYCYTTNGYFYYIKQTETTQGSPIYARTDGTMGARATSSSQLEDYSVLVVLESFSLSSVSINSLGYIFTATRDTTGDLYT